jgi:hypothetical protein
VGVAGQQLELGVALAVDVQALAGEEVEADFDGAAAFVQALEGGLPCGENRPVCREGFRGCLHPNYEHPVA